MNLLTRHAYLLLTLATVARRSLKYTADCRAQDRIHLFQGLRQRQLLLRLSSQTLEAL